MSKSFQTNDTLGEIVLQFPQAATLFKHYHLDFCCGGDRPLADVAQSRNLDAEALLQEVNEKYEAAQAIGLDVKDWMAIPYEGLIQHIVGTYHTYLKQEFPMLAESVAKVHRVHGEHHGAVLSVVHEKFDELRAGLEAHMQEEENVVFPQIIAYENAPSEEKRAALQQLLITLDREHEASGALLATIREVTQDYALPDDACRTFAYVYRALEELESNLFEHIHLENNVLFVRLSA